MDMQASYRQIPADAGNRGTDRILAAEAAERNDYGNGKRRKRRDDGDSYA